MYFLQKSKGVEVKQLTIDSFISNETDVELNQYKILSLLKEYRSEFNRNKLYPALAELVYLSSQLEEILDKKSNLSLPLPKGIKNGISEKNVIIELIDQSTEHRDYLYDLIEWALPVIKNLIDEAYVLYNFVEDNMGIEQVGIPPLYKDEGYLFVPDNCLSLLQIYRFECSIYSPGNKPYHSLKTRFVQTSKSLNFSGSADFVKIELVKKYKDPPNIATYLCYINLDFPYTETIFPIAKRKLLNYISENI